MKLQSFFAILVFTALVCAGANVRARTYADPVMRGTELGMFPDLRQTCKVDKEGNCITDKKGNPEMRAITDAEVKEQVVKKLQPFLKLRKIGEIQVEENQVVVNIVEHDGAHFYTMRVDRDKALSEREKPMVEDRNQRQADLAKSMAQARNAFARNESVVSAFDKDGKGQDGKKPAAKKPASTTDATKKQVEKKSKTESSGKKYKSYW